MDAFLAIIVGYMVDACVQPTVPGSLSAVRAHQRHMARTFTAMLARRRRWPRPAADAARFAAVAEGIRRHA